MGDIPNIDKNEIVVVSPDNRSRELYINADHSAQIDVRNIGGAGLTLGQKAMAASVPIVISSDQSVVPVQDVAGLYASQDKLYSLVTEANLAGTAEVDAILIHNPTGSGKIVYFQTMMMSLISTVGAQLRVRIYKAPTITANGTAITIYPARIGGSPPASVLTAYSLPTISARGNQLRVLSSNEYMTVIYPVASSIILEANQNLLITGQSSSTNKPLGMNLIWAEL